MADLSNLTCSHCGRPDPDAHYLFTLDPDPRTSPGVIYPLHHECAPFHKLNLEDLARASRAPSCI